MPYSPPLLLPARPLHLGLLPVLDRFSHLISARAIATHSIPLFVRQTFLSRPFAFHRDQKKRRKQSQAKLRPFSPSLSLILPFATDQNQKSLDRSSGRKWVIFCCFISIYISRSRSTERGARSGAAGSGEWPPRAGSRARRAVVGSGAGEKLIAFSSGFRQRPPRPARPRAACHRADKIYTVPYGTVCAFGLATQEFGWRQILVQQRGIASRETPRLASLQIGSQTNGNKTHNLPHRQRQEQIAGTPVASRYLQRRQVGSRTAGTGINCLNGIMGPNPTAMAAGRLELPSFGR